MSEEELINKLINNGYLRTEVIINAFKKIKREDFVLAKDQKDANVNVPLRIGYGQTISQPLTVALMFELLAPQEGDRVLDIGSGSGWTTALLSEIVGEHGKVFGLEIISELVDFGIANVSKYNFINKGIAQILQKDGYKGLPEFAPFDKIIISAAASRIPDELMNQLAIGGHLVAPIGEKGALQDLVVIDKLSNHQNRETRFPGFILFR